MPFLARGVSEKKRIEVQCILLMSPPPKKASPIQRQISRSWPHSTPIKIAARKSVRLLPGRHPATDATARTREIDVNDD